MASKGNNWKKVAGKTAKWTIFTALAGLGAAASQGVDVTDPKVAGQVALTAVLAGLFGGGTNAVKHRAAKSA